MTTAYGKERMTIKQVAEIAGVSSAAVSRYLNGGSLSEEKKERVRRAIEQTGYHPSAAGQMLRTGKVNQIGVIVPRINSNSVGHVTEGIAEKLLGTRYMMMLGSCNGEEQQELEYIEAMQASHVAGIILMGTTYTPAHAEAFRSCRVPLVVTGQKFPGVYCVYHDDRGAAKDLTKRMIARGRRNIGYIGVSERDPAVGLSRRSGVEEAMREAGLDPAVMPRMVGGFDAQSGAAGIMRLITMNPEIDGVICATDMIALGAMMRLRELDRRVPQDIAVAGFGDSWAGTIVEPMLTSVHLYQKQCGIEAAGMILALLDEKGEPPVRETRLGYTVVERGSL